MKSAAPQWEAALRREILRSVSSENVELMRRGFQAWSDRGLEGLHDYLDPEFEFHEDPRFPEGGTYRGREAFEAYVRQFLSAWEMSEWQLEEAIAVGEEDVLTLFRIKWRGEGSGVELEIAPGWIWTTRNGRAIRCRAFLDREEAFEAAGLVE